MRDMSWKDRGACNGMPTAIFFPERGNMVDVKRAKNACAVCPVREECLEYALTQESTDDCGIFGGTSARQRRAIRAQRAGRAAA